MLNFVLSDRFRRKRILKLSVLDRLFLSMDITANFLLKSGAMSVLQHLPLLLRIAWSLTIALILAACVPAAPFTSLRKHMNLYVGRGKLLSSSSSFKPKWTVPQSFFLHFYVVGAISTAFLLLCVILIAYGMDTSESLRYSSITSHLAGGSDSFSFGRPSFELAKHIKQARISALVLLLFEIQVLRRLYESLYVFSYSPSARMHILGYLTGIFFYLAAPLSMCSACAPEGFAYAINQAFNSLLRKQAQIADIELKFVELGKALVQLGWMQWAGALIFGWGWIHQFCCHKILGSLRSDCSQDKNGYMIPHGDWFQFVSCPHYLAEIVIYAGLLISSGGTDLTMWLLFGFVIANLAFAAKETHKWYLQKFDNYPLSRRAIIPFVF